MKRIFEKLLNEYLGEFPCVVILGPRQCGKTTLLKTLGNEWRYFDLERQADFDVVSHDPDLFLRLNPDNVAIDEAQVYPALFPALRVAIDQNRQKSGRFVITGSSSPSLKKEISESLAGRVAIIEMAPFSFAEIRKQYESFFFSAMKNGKMQAVELEKNSSRHSSLNEIHDYWFCGGYPEPWLKSTPGFRKTWYSNYVQTYLHRDVTRLFPGLNHLKFSTFLHMLGGLSGMILNHADMARALGVSQPTARDYLEIAHGTFVWRNLPAYASNPMKRIVKHPKGYIRDSGLHHFLLHVSGVNDLLAHPAAGRSWEGMVIEEILRGLNARGIHYNASHYRTAAGGEVDLVLEGEFGTLPVEIKHTQTVHVRELQALTNFIADYKCSFGIVVNNDERPRFYTERILGLPFAYL